LNVRSRAARGAASLDANDFTVWVGSGQRRQLFPIASDADLCRGPKRVGVLMAITESDPQAGPAPQPSKPG